MNEAEARLLNDLKKLDIWTIRGGSATLHFDGEGFIGQIEVHRKYKIVKKSTDASDVLDTKK